MNKIKVILTASLLSLVSFAWTSTSSAAEFAAGIGAMQGAWMGKGKEVIGTATGDTTEEDGAFEDGAPNVFIELIASDNFRIGIEHWPDSVDTPSNTNTGAAGPEGTAPSDDNTVKASFSNHTTLYGQVGLPLGLYVKAGIIYVDIETKESLSTGGTYSDADTMGYSLGFGYQHTLDNDVFIRAEINAASYDDVSGTNGNDSSKSVSVTDMYGAYGSIKIGRSF